MLRQRIPTARRLRILRNASFDYLHVWELNWLLAEIFRSISDSAGIVVSSIGLLQKITFFLYAFRMGATEAVIFKVPLRFETQRRICSNAIFVTRDHAPSPSCCGSKAEKVWNGANCRFQLQSSIHLASIENAVRLDKWLPEHQSVNHRYLHLRLVVDLGLAHSQYRPRPVYRLMA